MPELRKDPISGRWVIVAEGRAGRPNDFVKNAAPGESPGACPFCPGHEGETPHETLAYRAADSQPDRPGWSLRVVPNKFPAVEGREPFLRHGQGLYQSLPGVGVHEVIIESPRHVSSLTQLTPDESTKVFRAYRDRLTALRADERIAYGHVFKNVGAAAGASLAHAHSQLIGLPLAPIDVATELASAEAWLRARGSCIFCDLLAEELAGGERIVLETSRFVAFCPYAPRFPYETWVLPKLHASHFELTDFDTLAELAVVMRDLIAKMELALDRPAYNYWLHTGSLHEPQSPHYHWHFEVMPRLTSQAGFEWGTGMFINIVRPEEAAARLRESSPPA